MVFTLLNPKLKISEILLQEQYTVPGIWPKPCIQTSFIFRQIFRMSVNFVHHIYLLKMLDFGAPNMMSFIRFTDKNHENQMSLLNAVGIDYFILIWLVKSNMPVSLFELICIPNNHQRTYIQDNEAHENQKRSYLSKEYHQIRAPCTLYLQRLSLHTYGFKVYNAIQLRKISAMNSGSSESQTNIKKSDWADFNQKIIVEKVSNF